MTGSKLGKGWSSVPKVPAPGPRPKESPKDVDLGSAVSLPCNPLAGVGHPKGAR